MKNVALLRRKARELRKHRISTKETAKVLEISYGRAYYLQRTKEELKYLKKLRKSRKEKKEQEEYKLHFSNFCISGAESTSMGKRSRSFRVLCQKIVRFFRGNNKAIGLRTFNYKDVIRKFGKYPKCYLTGSPIDYKNGETYSLDHVVPRSKGGKNELDNLGLCRLDVNMMKGSLPLETFVRNCRTIAFYYYADKDQIEYYI